MYITDICLHVVYVPYIYMYTYTYIYICIYYFVYTCWVAAGLTPFPRRCLFFNFASFFNQFFNGLLRICEAFALVQLYDKECWVGRSLGLLS